MAKEKYKWADAEKTYMNAPGRHPHVILYSSASHIKQSADTQHSTNGTSAGGGLIMSEGKRLPLHREPILIQHEECRQESWPYCKG